MAARSPSFWLAIAVFTLTAVMVHPSFAAIFTLPADLALILALRWCARREGRRAALTEAYSLGTVVAKTIAGSAR